MGMLHATEFSITYAYTELFMIFNNSNFSSVVRHLLALTRNSQNYQKQNRLMPPCSINIHVVYDI